MIAGSPFHWSQRDNDGGTRVVAVEMEKSEWIQDSVQAVPPGIAGRLDMVCEERGIKHDLSHWVNHGATNHDRQEWRNRAGGESQGFVLSMLTL